MATFNTERLKQLVDYAIKGAGFDKVFELSNKIGISVTHECLHLDTTDGTNYLRVSDNTVSNDTDSFDVVVDAELFSKLISKTNSNTVDISVVDNALVVKGNGVYKLELTPSETGDNLVFVDEFPITDDLIGRLSAVDLINIYTAVGASLSNVAGDVYSSYYFGDVIASTNKTMMGVFNKQLLDTPYLFNKEFVDLLVMANSDVTLAKTENKIISEAELSDGITISVCTPISNGVADFNIEGIKKFTSLEINSFCRFKKVEMLDLLDRISLFVSKFEDGAIQMHFTGDCIEVSSLKSSGIEKIELTESKDAKDFTIKINIDKLRGQLKAYTSDIVDLYYGSEVCIKLIDNDITQVIALIK